MTRRLSTLPQSLPPVGVNRVQAAEFVGVSVNFFDAMVKAGTMPQPHRAGTRAIYDVAELVDAFRALPKADDEQDLSAMDAHERFFSGLGLSNVSAQGQRHDRSPMSKGRRRS
jgi:hypothetical protein